MGKLVGMLTAYYVIKISDPFVRSW